LIVLVFTLLHKGITYTANDFVFFGMLLALGLAWGGIMQKTDSIWGSILFHAGTDIPVFLGIFSNFQ
jgi:membrane protease YdiL (CAAX protease family)